MIVLHFNSNIGAVAKINAKPIIRIIVVLHICILTVSKTKNYCAACISHRMAGLH